MKTKLVLYFVAVVFSGALLSLSALGAELGPNHYLCGYSDDADRGIHVHRMELDLRETDEGLSACLTFLSYPTTPTAPVVRGVSCGVMNARYGVRDSDYGIPSVRFDGYEDYTDQSGVSIPPAKRRFAVFEFGSEAPRFRLRGDRQVQDAATYECVRQP